MHRRGRDSRILAWPRALLASSFRAGLEIRILLGAGSLPGSLFLENRISFLKWVQGPSIAVPSLALRPCPRNRLRSAGFRPHCCPGLARAPSTHLIFLVPPRVGILKLWSLTGVPEAVIRFKVYAE